MNANTIQQTQVLKGKTVFLSASIPEEESNSEYQVVPDAHIQIEEAIVSQTRAVLSAGGRLVFGGHPSISPLVAMVAAEYTEPQAAEDMISAGSGDEERRSKDYPLIHIFQSDAFRGSLPDETWELFRLGYATIHWTPAAEDERCDPKEKHESQCPQSLLRMRQEMLEYSKPDAMVCIGGMGGVIEEVHLFLELRSGSQIYVFGTTGGAAKHLAKSGKELRVIDQEVLKDLEKLSPDISPVDEDKSPMKDLYERDTPEDEIAIIPYPYIAQVLVREVGRVDAELQETSF